MNPKIISVKEGRSIGPGGKQSKIIIVTYNVGDDGPFTLETTEADLASGAALAKMQEFGRSISTLPRL